MSVSPIVAMFDRISFKYDALNHLLSLNVDKIWRKKTAKNVFRNHPQTILDLATGTADLAISLAKCDPKSTIIGMDISEKMLNIGKEKVHKQKLESQIDLRLGDAASLPFEDNSFDAVTVAFGVRNFENLDKCLSEIYRVLKVGGQVAILELSMPEMFPVKQLYRFYFTRVLPSIGWRISKDSNAYTYLPTSVAFFPKPDKFMRTLVEKGWVEGKVKRLTFGIAILFLAKKGFSH